MKERGKAVEAYNGNIYTDFNYSSSDMPCRKHPSSSSVGICAYCLKERLVKLVCSECGEQRLSSCSCSDISSYRNSSCTADVGSFGRMSFLIENEKTELQQSNPKPKKGDKSDEVILLRRSSSSCVEVKRYKGFWKIKRLFRKKKNEGCEKNSGFDDRSDIWVSEIMGVSRSRSLCSFNGGGRNDTDEGSDYRFSSAKISDVTGGVLFDYEKSESRKTGFRGVSDEAEPRKSGFGVVADEAESTNSGFRGLLDEVEPRKSGFRGLSDQEEPRKSAFRGVLDAENGIDLKGVKKVGVMELDRTNSVPNRSIFPVKECDFTAMDESAFIDLKLDLSLQSKSELSAVKINEASSDHAENWLRGEIYESGVSFGNLSHKNGLFGDGGSCRITVSDAGLKRGSNSYNLWKWFSRHYHGGRSASKKDENHTFSSLDKDKNKKL